MSEITKFEFSLRTLAPVHIGCGKTYSQREYIYDGDNYYYFPDMGILYRKLMKIGKAQRFENFLMDHKAQRLTDFLNQIKFSDRDLGGYKVKETKFENKEKPGWLNEISQFVKDPYGNPYIPGSSLKGALRTILVNEKFGTDRIKFGGPNDIFNQFHVSDSEPIDSDRLILVQKWDFNSKKEPHSLPIWRESIKPYTEVKFTITITSDEAKDMAEHLEKYADSFYRRYHRDFLREYENVAPEYIQDNVRHPLYLGMGTGLWTKADYRHIDLNDIQRRYNRNRKMKMKGKGVLKLTKTRGLRYHVKKKDGSKEERRLLKNQNHEYLYEMGKCGFKIKKIG